MTETVLSSPAAGDIHSIRQRRMRRVVAVVYCTYGDESRDDSKNRVYAVAGVFGHQDEWDSVEVAWNKRLEGRVFHAADCESDHGEFASPCTHDDNQRLYRDLVTIVAGKQIMAQGIVVNVQDYMQAFPEAHEHEPYVWGFGDVVHAASDLAYLAIPQEEVKIVFDRNEDLEFSAAAMYAFLLRSKKVATRNNLFGEIAFACRRTVGIQVADLFARESMKRVDNQSGPIYRPERLSFSALSKNGKLKLICYDKDRIAKKKSEAPHSILSQATMQEYRKWLSQKGLEDNIVNRVNHVTAFPSLWEY